MMSEYDHPTSEEAWIPAGKWKHRWVWPMSASVHPPVRPDWHEQRPPKRQSTARIILLLWVVVPSALLGWQRLQHCDWPRLDQQIRSCGLETAPEPATPDFEALRDSALERVEELKIVILSTDRSRNEADGLVEESERIRAQLQQLRVRSEELMVLPEHQQKHEVVKMALRSAFRALDSIQISLGSALPTEREWWYQRSLRQVEEAQAQLVATEAIHVYASR